MYNQKSTSWPAFHTAMVRRQLQANGGFGVGRDMGPSCEDRQLRHLANFGAYVRLLLLKRRRGDQSWPHHNRVCLLFLLRPLLAARLNAKDDFG